MRCPNCEAPETRVTDSRDTGQEIRRRRECLKCQARFTTYERVQHAALGVVKRDGRREEFGREKLLKSIRLACVKRPLPTGAIEKLADEIESDLQRLGRAEVPASVIGDTVLARLREIDPVAYVRYASVYRDFDSLEGFVSEIQQYHAVDEKVAEQQASGQLSLIPAEFAILPRPRPRRGRRPRITAPADREADGAEPAPAN